MEYTTLGNTGMTVSRLCLGCWSFGSGMEWMLDEDESHDVIDRAIDLGINFFDTANIYSNGESEAILGDALDGYDRDRLVVETKVFNRMDPDDPNSGGLSRKTIEQQLAASLDRLGMDAVDIYLPHRWDYDTPIDATLRTLDDAISREKTRYIGASAMWTHQFAEALHTSERLGLEPFRTMQPQYNLVYREEEREMLPFCEKRDVAVTPYSPMASGYLTTPHEAFDETDRARDDDSVHSRPFREGGGPQINARVEELAADEGVSMAQLSLAWVLHKDAITAPLVGVESVEQLEEAVDALDISLSESDIDYLEEPYEPVSPSGPL